MQVSFTPWGDRRANWGQRWQEQHRSRHPWPHSFFLADHNRRVVIIKTISKPEMRIKAAGCMRSLEAAQPFQIADAPTMPWRALFCSQPVTARRWLAPYVSLR